MKKLVNGIALYDLEELSIKSAFYLADKFFKSINIKPDAIYYFYSHSSDKGGETVSTMDVTFDELKIQIEKGIISNFRMHYGSTEILWDVGFAFFDKNSKFGEGINYIEIQFLDKLLSMQEIKDILISITDETRIKYGIGYQLYDTMGECFNYALCLDCSTIYNYENSSAWLYQLPSRTDDTPQYFYKLRMVYPLNILNKEHINLEINELNIQSWIKSDPKNGKLEKINENYLWTVEPLELDRINKIFGENGLLISYQPNVNIPKPKRRLP